MCSTTQRLVRAVHDLARAVHFHLVTVVVALVGLDRDGRLVGAVLPVVLDDVLVDVDDFLHRSP